MHLRARTTRMRRIKPKRSGSTNHANCSDNERRSCIVAYLHGVLMDDHGGHRVVNSCDQTFDELTQICHIFPWKMRTCGIHFLRLIKYQVVVFARHRSACTVLQAHEMPQRKRDRGSSRTRFTCKRASSRPGSVLRNVRNVRKLMAVTRARR